MSNTNTTPTQTQEELQAQLAALQAQLGATAPATAPVEAEVVEAEVVETEQVEAPAPKKKAAAKKKKAAPTPPPAPAESTTELAAPTAGLAALFGGDNPLMAVDALDEFEDTASGGSYLFPELQHDAKSNTFVRARHMADGDGTNMPEGAGGFCGVLLGYRFRATAWPEGYGGDKKTPVYSVAIGPSARADVVGMKAAANAYQYTPSADKSKWDYDGSGVGHTRCQLELLCYDPEDDSLFVLQGASHFSGTEKTRSEISKHIKVNPENGQRTFVPFVAEFRPEVDRSQKTKGGYNLEVPYIGMNVNLTPALRTSLENAWSGFQEFVAAAADNEELTQRVIDWTNGADSPVTATARDAWAAVENVG